jgi:hypothetical protein
LIVSCLTAALTQGCVIHAPLTAEADYPKDWPAISPANPDCKLLDGIYANTGVRIDKKGNRKPVSLVGALVVLGLEDYYLLPAWTPYQAPHAVSLKVSPMKECGRANCSDFYDVTAYALTNSGPRRIPPFPICTCMKQTLWCAKDLGYTSGGAFMSTATDGSLIAKVHTTGLIAWGQWWFRFERLGELNQ